MKPVLAALALALLPWPSLGEGIEPRSGPDEYAAHGNLGGVVFAAESGYRSVPADSGSIFLREGLVIEVAFFGPKRGQVETSEGRFTLRVNGKGDLLSPVAPALLLFNERYGGQPRLDIGIGVGNNGGTVIVGGPEVDTRYPEERRRGPGAGPGASTSEEPTAAVEVMRRAALPTGAQTLPIAGCLYFQYGKKMKSIKQLELLYYQPSGTVTLRLK